MPHFFVFFNVRKNFFTRVLRLLYIVFQMQNVRRQIVEEVLHSCVVDEPQMRALDEALEELTDSRTVGEMRHISTPTADFPINIRDEIRGLRVSFTFFLSSRRLNSSATFCHNSSFRRIKMPLYCPAHLVVAYLSNWLSFS